MDWVERVGKLRQWAQNGVRAPHKPLLMLYALGSFQRDPLGSMRYSDIEHDLSELLEDYGPTRRTSPSYPFHHLVSDGVWEVRTDSGSGSPGTGVRVLRESGARGQLTGGLRAALSEDPELLGHRAAARQCAGRPGAHHLAHGAGVPWRAPWSGAARRDRARVSGGRLPG